MLDEHIADSDLGLMPFIDLWGLRIPSYALFMALAFAAGYLCFRLTATKTDRDTAADRALIIVFALPGGIVGAKLPVLLWNYRILFRYPDNISLLLSGRTIVGGLIGGYLSVLFVKKKLKLTVRTGNDIAAPAALGMAVGRIGCLMSGCCYGIEAPRFLGIDFGDGLYRWPTQIYEMIFDLGMFAVFLYLKKTRELRPGILFRYLLNAYFIFRFFIEFIRVTDAPVWGISLYQILCVACLLFVNRDYWMRRLLRGRSAIRKTSVAEERKT